MISRPGSGRSAGFRVAKKKCRQLCIPARLFDAEQQWPSFLLKA
jgi:hypothetical protein